MTRLKRGAVIAAAMLLLFYRNTDKPFIFLPVVNVVETEISLQLLEGLS